MGWKRSNYIKQRSEGFKGLFPGKLALVEASVMAGMLIKYDEDFLICSKIEKAMGDGIKRVIDEELPIAEKLRAHINFDEP